MSFGCVFSILATPYGVGGSGRECGVVRGKEIFPLIYIYILTPVAFYPARPHLSRCRTIYIVPKPRLMALLSRFLPLRLSLL